MSLTVALDDPKSSVNAFFDEHLPHHELLTRPWARNLQQHSWTRSIPASRTPHLIGAAIEIRLGFDLAQILPYGELTAAVSLPDGLDAIRALGFSPPADDDGLPTWQKGALIDDHYLLNDHDRQVEASTLCWRVAYVESIAHALGNRELNTPENLSAFWAHNRHSPPQESIEALLRLWYKYLAAARATFAGLGEPTTIRPSFANRFAVGDLLLGNTLIEVKCELRPEAQLPRTLRQVLACALADSDDELSIEGIGVYHAYEGSVTHWPLTRVLQSLSPTGHASLPELRARFAETIATERRTIDERGS
ncbi:hypothetical protein [Kribbella sp. CA-293567]|uniref:hypothetical protein n=1 Tax=Kribbella sp. CA-293567 TaxID=3002436 RepID=UPI0022DD6B42|nr:hypothetical protein [Kribbella sp. CA-293567]WBQ04467.1 hypothetical protein OX958_31455 [Kribbella sp. CA-293567]